MQIQLEKTLDVEIVEHHLAELWKQTTGSDDEAVLRARVANLLIFVPDEKLLSEVDDLMPDLTAMHPSRVLMMLGDRQAADRDIEMFVTSFCQIDKRSGAKRLCGEEVTLKAAGKFVSELPSAALPLLVPDLSTFLWWRGALQLSDKVFGKLLKASDRLVVDSSEFLDPQRELVDINNLFQQKDFRHAGISDINWARLTLWRGLLADFYDVPEYQPLLDELDYVRIDYVAPELAPGAVASQALLIAGWLASRLGWSFQSKRTEQNEETVYLELFGKDERTIKLELNRVAQAGRKPGRLALVELQSTSKEPASFVVSRSEDGLHLFAEARVGRNVHRGRVLPVRNRSAAQLLGREMEILSNDRIYQEAVSQAIKT